MIKIYTTINISSNEVAPVSKALDRLAGIIKDTGYHHGNYNRKKPLCKSLISFCLRLSSLEMYINKASFAKSLV
jgi:hypothetical protein